MQHDQAHLDHPGVGFMGLQAQQQLGCVCRPWGACLIQQKEQGTCAKPYVCRVPSNGYGGSEVSWQVRAVLNAVLSITAPASDTRVQRRLIFGGLRKGLDALAVVVAAAKCGWMGLKFVFNVIASIFCSNVGPINHPYFAPPTFEGITCWLH